MIANDYIMVKLNISPVCLRESSSFSDSQNLREPLPDKHALPATNSKSNPDTGFAKRKHVFVAWHQQGEKRKLLKPISPRMGELSIYEILERGGVLRMDVGDWKLGEGEGGGTILLFLHRHRPLTYLYILVCTEDGGVRRSQLMSSLYFSLGPLNATARILPCFLQL